LVADDVGELDDAVAGEGGGGEGVGEDGFPEGEVVWSWSSEFRVATSSSEFNL